MGYVGTLLVMRRCASASNDAQYCIARALRHFLWFIAENRGALENDCVT
nr:hypothetical protein DO63_1698 [Burkholderia pseudomallei]